jgi:hypothetical protein
MRRIPEAKGPRGGFQPTRNASLLVRWEQDIHSPAGVGILTMSIPRNSEQYVLISVPKKFYLDLMHRSDPEMLFNQLLKMYLKDEPQPDEYQGEW